MKRLLLALLFAAPLAAQTTTTPLTFPTLTDPIAQAGSANTNLTMALLTWQNTTEHYLQDHEIRLKTLESTVTQIAVQSDTIGKLQQQITALQAAVQALTPVATPLPPAQVTMHFEAEGTNTPGVTIQNSLDVGGGSKVVLAAGQKLSFNILVPSTKVYTFTARVGSDPGTLGNLAFHFETANANSGPMTASGGGTWNTSTPGKPMALTAGPAAITFVVDSPSITGGAFYLNWAEALSQ
jgi:hypothetical protein